MYLLVMLAAVTAGLVAGTSPGAASVARPVTCTVLACGDGVASASPAEGPGQPAGDPCGHHHPLCGDTGTATDSSSSLPLGALVLVGLVAGLGLLAGQRVRPGDASLRSMLLASGLEHPPRRLV